MTAVAALYIDPRGPYPTLRRCYCEEDRRECDCVFVDCWDVFRDARLYDGPHPVVAHPPCGPWGRLRHLYRGYEHDCAPRAVEQVRRWGGVLEHPAGSKLWEHCGLPVPPYDYWEEDTSVHDSFGGYTIQIEQVEWGHVARKRTWLYLVGVPREALEGPPYPGRQPTHWCSGGRDYPGRKHRGMVAPPGIKCASAQQRRRTPRLFAEYLIRLARSVKR